jgi:hypothetical protein
MILVILCLLMTTSCILIRIIMIRRKKGIIVDNKWINIAIVVFSFIYVGIISYFVTDINIALYILIYHLFCIMLSCILIILERILFLIV